MNIGCYKEAAEHFLAGLNSHIVSNGTNINISNTLWDTLARNFVLVHLNLPRWKGATWLTRAVCMMWNCLERNLSFDNIIALIYSS